jgi:hypothetical protein
LHEELAEKGDLPFTPSGDVLVGGRLNKRQKRPIDMGNARDVLYWAGLWGLTDQELFNLVAAVGPIPADVGAYIGQPLASDDRTVRSPRAPEPATQPARASAKRQTAAVHPKPTTRKSA